jgi:hypothetical protein
MRKPKNVGNMPPRSAAALISSAVAVSREEKESNANVLGASATGSENLRAWCGQWLVEVGIPLVGSTLTPKSAVITT